MSREELRVDGLAEPISHFTDAVRAGGFLYVSGIVAVDGDGRLVGGEDVVAQTRQVFENMRAILDAGGCGFEDVVKVTVFLTDIDDRPLINPVRQEVFGSTRPASTLVEVPRLAVGREGRDRVRRARPVSDDPFNAFITGSSPASRARGRSPGRTLAVKDLFDTAGIRTTYGSGLYAEHVPERNATAVQLLLDAGAVLVGKTHLPEFAWSVLGQSEWYGTCHNPAHPGRRPAARRPAPRPRSPPGSASSRSGPTPAVRSASRRPPARSWGSSRSGA